MTLLTPHLILVALAALWTLIAATVLLILLSHALRRGRSRHREELDRRARPLVVRFALAEEDDPALEGTLARASGAFGDRVDERLLSVLETLRGDSRERIVALLVDRGHPPRLRRRARSRRTTVRAAALRRLGQLALPTDEDLIRGATADPSPVVAAIAIRAAASYPGRASVAAALERLRGRGEVPALVVVTSLIAQGAASADALAAIREGLADPSSRVRAACAQTLGELTSTADAAALGRLLRRDPTPGVQLAAATALERVGRASAVPALLDGTRSPWGPVRTHSLLALLALPREVTAAALVEVARRPDPLLTPLLAAQPAPPSPEAHP